MFDEIYILLSFIINACFGKKFIDKQGSQLYI